MLFALMIVTLFMGTDILGARRWIYLGPASVQPSEFAKIILVLIVAKYFDEFQKGNISVRMCALTAGGSTILMLVFVLIGQSDLGTTIICVIGILTLLMVAGIPT